MLKTIKTATIIAIMLFSVVVMYVPQNAEAQGLSVIINLSPASAEVFVSPSEQGVAEFSGSGSITSITGSTQVTIQLSGSISGIAGSVIVTPPQIVFTAVTPGTSYDFSFSVIAIIPPATSSLVPGKVRVDAIARAAEGPTMSTYAEASIKVLQYFRVEVESGNPYIEASPGSRSVFSLKITNKGNGLDSFDLEVSNIKSLTDSGWVITLSRILVDGLESQGTATFTVTAQAPRDWTIWKTKGSMIEVKVTSVTAQEKGAVGGLSEQIYPVHVYERGMYISGFDPIFLIFALALMTVVFKKKVVKKK